MTTLPISLTGIKPTGTIHLGNYLGAIKPALDLIGRVSPYYFVADYHALTTVKDPDALKKQTLTIAAAWMACGLDPASHMFYRQSDLPELCELAWILSCYASKGLLNRAHSYKSLVDVNVTKGADRDNHITMGLFSYPVLMAADILAFDCQWVPVGVDQKQHVEIARDIALSFNRCHGDVFTIPEALISSSVQTVPGTDGRKMSKNYNNIIPLFGSASEIKKAVMQIKTESTPLEDPKQPDTCTVFTLYSLFASPEEIEVMRQRYQSGGYGFGHAKLALFDVLQCYFKKRQSRFESLMAEPQIVLDALSLGAERARGVLVKKLRDVKSSIGLI